MAIYTYAQHFPRNIHKISTTLKQSRVRFFDDSLFSFFLRVENSRVHLAKHRKHSWLINRDVTIALTRQLNLCDHVLASNSQNRSHFVVAPSNSLSVTERKHFTNLSSRAVSKPFRPYQLSWMNDRATRPAQSQRENRRVTKSFQRSWFVLPRGRTVALTRGASSRGSCVAGGWRTIVAKGLGGTAHHFRPSKMPFIHHAAHTLTRRAANTFIHRQRRDAEGVMHPVSYMHPFAKGR